MLALGVFGDEEDRTSQAYVIYRTDIEKAVIDRCSGCRTETAAVVRAVADAYERIS